MPFFYKSYPLRRTRSQSSKPPPLLSSNCFLLAVIVEDNRRNMNNDGNDRKHLGDGIAQWQGYCVTCAAALGIYTPHPADHHHFNCHPCPSCVAAGHCISYVSGCSVHNGVLDQFGRCVWCEDEKIRRIWHNSIALVDKIGYHQ
jgi:hypothetical protein